MHKRAFVEILAAATSTKAGNLSHSSFITVACGKRFLIEVSDAGARSDD
jgi:hypothetical protein